MLFAESPSFFPPEFLPSLAMSGIYLVVAAVFFIVFWKFADWLTPGQLDKELLGTPESKNADGTTTPAKAPNLALGLVMAALIIGFCQIIVAAIR
jgi:hypothetical protein